MIREQNKMQPQQNNIYYMYNKINLIQEKVRVRYIYHPF
jgi:hypothetical protein